MARADCPLCFAGCHIRNPDTLNPSASVYARLIQQIRHARPLAHWLMQI